MTWTKFLLLLSIVLLGLMSQTLWAVVFPDATDLYWMEGRR